MTRFTYDTNGNVLTITDPLNNTRTFTYDSTFNQVTSITDPLGNLTTFDYDPQGNLTGITDPLQNTQPAGSRLKTTLTYNSFGQLLTTTDPLGNTTTFTYDDVGDLASVSDPLGNTTQRSYDTVSRLVTQTDPLGNTTRFSYDSLNRLVTIVDALNGGTTFGYDPNGNLLSVTDARGNAITYEYDGMNQLSRRVDPLGAADLLRYDLRGNLSQTVDRKGQTTQYAYDALDRRMGATFADGSTKAYTYDAASRMISIADSVGGTITWAYDALDQLIGETTPQGSVTYAYDAAGHRTALTVGGQAPITYTWDPNDRPVAIGSAALAAGFTYDAADRRTRLALPSGVGVEYAYDQANQLTELRYLGPSGLLGNVTYTYDPAGHRIGVGGSWARSLLPTPVLTSSYDSANRQLTFGGKALSYDATGNLLTLADGGATTTYTWDARDRLAAVSGSDYSATFAYDGTSRRTQKVVNGLATTFLYDGREVVGEATAGAGVSYLRGPRMDEPLLGLSEAGQSGYLADDLGSILALTDGGGNVSTTYTYDPFGLSAPAGPASDNALQFTAREDDGAGLYFYRMRYYRPDLARFLSEDPLGLSGGFNLYAYVGDAPTQYVDPFGLRCLSPQEGQKIVEKAREWVDAGVPYKEGGKDRKGADCSGGVNRIYEEAGYPYPYRRSGEFAGLTKGWKGGGRFVVTTSPQPGDIASFPNHLGIYDPNGPIDPSRPRMGNRTIVGPTSSKNPAGYRHAIDFGKPRYFRYDTPDDPGVNCP